MLARMLRQGPAHDQDASQRAASSSYGLHSPALFMAINPLPSAQAGVPACQKGLDAGRMLRQGPAQDEGACQQPVSWCLGSRDLHLLWSQQLLGHFKWPDTSNPGRMPRQCSAHREKVANEMRVSLPHCRPEAGQDAVRGHQGDGMVREKWCDLKVGLPASEGLPGSLGAAIPRDPLAESGDRALFVTCQHPPHLDAPRCLGAAGMQ